MGDTKTIRPFALKGHGSIAHSASPDGLLPRSPTGLIVNFDKDDNDSNRNENNDIEDNSNNTDGYNNDDNNA